MSQFLVVEDYELSNKDVSRLLCVLIIPECIRILFQIISFCFTFIFSLMMFCVRLLSELMIRLLPHHVQTIWLVETSSDRLRVLIWSQKSKLVENVSIFDQLLFGFEVSSFFVFFYVLDNSHLQRYQDKTKWKLI